LAPFKKHFILKNYLFFIFIASLVSNAVRAQLTKGETLLLDRINGEKLFVLNDSIPIGIGLQESGWYKAQVKALVPKQSVGKDSVLAAGTALINAAKKEIGSSKSESKVVFRQAEGRGFSKFYEVIISGYVKSYSIHYRSIPEKGLEEILNDSKVAGKMEKLEIYFKAHQFVKQQSGEYLIWAYLDRQKSLGEPAYRTLVIIKGETMVYAVVSRFEEMSLDKTKDTKKDHTGNYYFYQRPTDRSGKEIQDIVYSFIPLDED
jgi:hypothetical protein